MDLVMIWDITRGLFKYTPVRGDARSVQGIVVGRDLCDDVCGIGPSVSLKRPCVHQPSSVPSPDQGSLVRKYTTVGGGSCGVKGNVDGREFYANICGVGPSVSLKRQYRCRQPGAIGCQSLSHSMFDVGINGHSIDTSGCYDHAMHVVHTNTSSNYQLGSGSQQPTIHVSSGSTHGLPNTNNRSRARWDRTRWDFAIAGDDLNLQQRTSGPPQIVELYFGAYIDESINNGHGPYVFKISGQLYHWIGSLCLEEGQPPWFLQLYNYDTDKKLFGTTREKFEDTHIPNFKVRLYNVIGTWEYELPIRDMLGAIVYETGLEADMDYDIILEEHGYSKELKMIGPTGSSSKQKCLTMLAYYSYYLHDRTNLYNYLSRNGRLFQQYVVTAFCAIEQNQIDFIQISEYMAQFPLLTTTNRADVLDRVFEMAIHQFVNYLRNDQPFGKVVAGNKYSLKDKNEAKTDKTKHGIGQSVKNRSRRYVYLLRANPYPR
ncbi:hypothetical protein Tco_0710319 [Tanacetum coccineum]